MKNSGSLQISILKSRFLRTVCFCDDMVSFVYLCTAQCSVVHGGKIGVQKNDLVCVYGERISFCLNPAMMRKEK